MSEDRPLTEFSSTDANPEDSAEADSTGVDTVDPATVSYRWQPDGEVCEQCGASSDKQWLDGDEFVCPDCKSWA